VLADCVQFSVGHYPGVIAQKRVPVLGFGDVIRTHASIRYDAVKEGIVSVSDIPL
jgi:hypothetical protein